MSDVIHIAKLAAGIKTREQFLERHRHNVEIASRGGFKNSSVVITRNRPKQERQLLNGGSLYWIYNGFIHCRQNIMKLHNIRADDGKQQCLILLDSHIQWTTTSPRKAFQGWRYLEQDSAPADRSDDGSEEMPESLIQELTNLGLM